MDKRAVKVVFVSPFTSGGGACRNMFNVINQLDQGFETKLVVTGTDTLPTEYEGLIETETLGSPSVTGAFRAIRRIIKSFAPDFVFATTLNTGLVCAAASKFSGVKCKTIARCTVPPSEIYNRSLKIRLLRLALQLGGCLIDLVISQTEYMRSDLINYYKFPANKVRTIRNIVDVRHITQQSARGAAPELTGAHYNILSVGALYSVKGFDILIDALAPIIQNHDQVHLYIIGEERYEEGYKCFLQGKIDSLGLSDSIHLLGQRSNPFPYYEKADLFVLSSRKEGYPNVVLEALSLKTPVVATDVVDFSDVIFNGVNGYIVKKQSVESLSKGLTMALANRNNLRVKDPILNFDYRTLFS